MRFLNNSTEASVIPISQEKEDAWWIEFGSVFWLTMSGAFFGFMVAVLNAILKSRCKNCNFLCFKCERSYEDDVLTPRSDGLAPIINSTSGVNLVALDIPPNPMSMSKRR